jgi:hypothetical protein
MVTDLLKHWEVAVDGLQICLCILILFFLIRRHRRKMKPDLMNLKSESGQDFNLQVFSQAINQQVELAFANILQVAARERRNLDKVLQSQQFKYSVPRSPGSLTPSLPSHPDNAAQSGQDIEGLGEDQARIQKLSTQGRTAKQISEDLKTPLGEVELILSLQKNRTN